MNAELAQKLQGEVEKLVHQRKMKTKTQPGRRLASPYFPNSASLRRDGPLWDQVNNELRLIGFSCLGGPASAAILGACERISRCIRLVSGNPSL